MPETEAQALAGALGRSDEPPLTIKNSTIFIEPLTIDQIAQIMLCIDRLAEKGINLEGGLNYTQLALRGGADFVSILAIASKQSSEFVGGLNVLELAKLAGKVWKVNKDFFGDNQVEILQAFGLDESHVAELKKLVGSIKSLVTSAPTESPTSEVSPSEKSSQSAEA